MSEENGTKTVELRNPAAKQGDGTLTVPFETFARSFSAMRSVGPLSDGRSSKTDPVILDGPSLDKGRPSTYRSFEKNKLFVNGPSFRDPIQRRLPDCGLVAALSGVAGARKEAIRSAVWHNKDGTDTVRFFEFDDNGKVTGSTEVRVDSRLPVIREQENPTERSQRDQNPDFIFAHSVSPNERWVGVIEKAWAVYKGNNTYADVKSVSAGDVAARLLGHRYTRYTFEERTPETIFAAMKDALANGGTALAGTPDKLSKDKTGIIGDHYYTVLRVIEHNGTRRVQLRNPWGRAEPRKGGFSSDGDGIFTIPFEKFMRDYDMVDVVPRPGPMFPSVAKATTSSSPLAAK